jgi:uncharacterized protein YkwD
VADQRRGLAYAAAALPLAAIVAMIAVIVMVAHDAQTAVQVETTPDRDASRRPSTSTQSTSTTLSPTTEVPTSTTEAPPPTADATAPTVPSPPLTFSPPPPLVQEPAEPPMATDPAPDPAAEPAPEPDPLPVAIAPPASRCDTTQGGVAGAVITAMNRDRAAAGAAPLCPNSQLVGFAQSWANWMAQNQALTHQDLNALLAQTSFSTMAENIAGGGGLDTADAIEQLWMNSPPHRANILNGSLNAVGVGIAYSTDGQAWIVADFGG